MPACFHRVNNSYINNEKTYATSNLSPINPIILPPKTVHSLCISASTTFYDAQTLNSENTLNMHPSQYYSYDAQTLKVTKNEIQIENMMLISKKLTSDFSDQIYSGHFIIGHFEIKICILDKYPDTRKT